MTKNANSSRRLFIGRTYLKIIFVYPQWTGKLGLISGYFARRAGGIIPPLNLGLLAAIAREGGHECSIIDAEIDRINQE